MSEYVGGDLEADAVLLAPGLGVGVVAAEDEAGAGEGGLLHGRLDGVVHVRLAWSHPVSSSSGQIVVANCAEYSFWSGTHFDLDT